MSVDEDFGERMAPVAKRYYSLLLQKEQIDNLIGETRNEVQEVLSTFNRDKFDDPNSPVIVTFKLQSAGERMKKGGKEILKNMLTDEQWYQVYNPAEKKPRLLVKRRDKLRET